MGMAIWDANNNGRPETELQPPESFYALPRLINDLEYF